MTYVMVTVLLVALAGAVAWAVMAERRRRGQVDPTDHDADVTERDQIPPVHPDRPLPGSDASRRRDGKP